MIEAEGFTSTAPSLANGNCYLDRSMGSETADDADVTVLV